jgi:hypothetical protein
VGAIELMKYSSVPCQQSSDFTACETLNLLDALPHLNVRARTFILEGVVSPGRHSAAFATAKNLHELGVPEDRALEWLLIGAGKCWMNNGMKWLVGTHPLETSEVQRIVKQVYGK